MKILLDTNILISAAIRDRLPEKTLLWCISNEDCEWIANEDILTEYLDVLKRPKFKIPSNLIEWWTDLILREASLVPNNDSSAVSFDRDEGDAKFLSCALASKADYFITGDQDFSGIKDLPHTKILSVAKFAKLMNIK